jgi:hypothetical protein
MGKIVDITGLTFGSWTVVGATDSASRQKRWLCRCVCGTQREVVGTSLRSGASTNCGCKRREHVGNINRSHGASRTAEYRVWKHMHARCSDPADKRYENYGGRGIRVCARWNRFDGFIADVGPRPSAAHSIERLSVDGDYEPANVIWATAPEQARNKTTTVFISVDGKVGRLVDFADELRLPYDTLYKRASRGSFGVKIVSR